MTANSSLLSPTGCVNTIPPNTEKWLRKFYMKNNGYEKSYENEVNENYSITSKTGTTRTSTGRPQSTTPMTTLTSTDAWRTCTESARTAHLFHSCDCLTLHSTAQVLSAFTLHPWSSTWRTLLDSTSPFSSTSSSCLSPSSSSTSSCLSSSTRSAWQTTCAAPLQKRVRTP